MENWIQVPKDKAAWALSREHTNFRLSSGLGIVILCQSVSGWFYTLH